VTDADIALVTLLGSCVAACLRDPATGIGGINHFMLPEGRIGVASESARYGGYAMELLINELLKKGAARARLEAKVFGGGNVLSGFTRANVGDQNATFVREYLQRERIPVVAEDLRGLAPRKIWYFPRTGRTLVKTLPNAGEVRSLERMYESRLHQQPVDAGDVELFE
jgi:chemotaxis protein CheD